MKKYIITLFFLGFTVGVFAQNFSTSLYISNKNGERDTLIVGYDVNATLGVDSTFGEFDFGSPIDSSRFSLFMKNVFPDGFDGNYGGPFLKTNIMPQATSNYLDLTAVILVPYEDLPITISWDQAMFNHNYSIITDWPSKGWVDVGISGTTVWEHMKDTSWVMFAPHENLNEEITKYEFVFQGKKMRMIYVLLGDSVRNPIKIEKEMAYFPFSIYPNPVVSELKITNHSQETIQDISIVNMAGSIVNRSKGGNEHIDCSKLSAGIYIVKIKTNKSLYFSKIIKN